ncbi:MAG: Piwi domain-containing protein [Longimonas sp.]|uniref:Piwi domain-containing protein n=1 Tax=Longimonas sp. TaxID=2039626 RepID=UPI00336314BD
MSTLLTEVFPINTTTLPKLHAYRLEGPNNTLFQVGGRLAGFISWRTDAGGTWAWSKPHRRLLSDVKLTEGQLEDLLEQAWNSRRKTYHTLQRIALDPNFTVDAQAQADYVAWGVWRMKQREINNLLRQHTEEINAFRIKRTCRRSSWVVDGHPALQISVSSKANHTKTLGELFDENPELDLMGLDVRDHTKDRPFTTTILEDIGPISEHRKRLLSFGLQEEMADLVNQADGDRPVVRVGKWRRLNGKTYDYVIDALSVVVSPRHYDQLGIPGTVQNKFTLSPKDRTEVLRTVSKPLKRDGLIGRPFTSRSASAHFGTAADVSFQPAIKFADESTKSLDETKGVRVGDVARHGAYQLPDAVQAAKNEERKVAIHVAMIGVEAEKSSFGQDLKTKLEKLGLSPLLFYAHSVSPDPAAIKAKIRAIKSKDVPVDGLIAIIPDSGSDVYRTWKQETVRRDWPNQVLQEGTLGNTYAIDNLALALFAKMGGVPYILANKLPYADRVVGLDIGRVLKERSEGTMSTAASTHLHGPNGKLIGYRLENAGVEGETIPPDVLRSMFPSAAYAGKRVVVHRDGPFRGNEVQALESIAQNMNSTFFLVEVRKQKAPRLYRMKNGNPVQATKGDHFIVSDRRAFLVSSPPPFDGATAQPLQICLANTELPPSEEFSITEALHSVLALTLMHYGANRLPRLPVSLHYADSVADRLQNGIRIPDDKGRLPYWL